MVAVSGGAQVPVTGLKDPLLSAKSQNQGGSADVWRQICSPLFDVAPFKSDLHREAFKSQVWIVGSCVFCRTISIGAVLKRRRQHIDATGQFFVLSRFIDGRVIGTTEDQPFDVGAGSVALHDYSFEFHAIQYPATVDFVFIPHSLLGHVPSASNAIQVFEAGTATATELSGEITHAFGQLPRSEGLMRESALTRLCSVVELILAGRTSLDGARYVARRAQKNAIIQYVEQNLSDLSLTTDAILKEFAVSRATLYRLFEAQGGVRNYIVDRRLFRALYDIANGPQERGQIQAAAKRWGFSSAANFNRSVRRAFGVTPGALFQCPLHASTQSNSESVGSNGPGDDRLVSSDS